jgi:hypothetical protein
MTLAGDPEWEKLKADGQHKFDVFDAKRQKLIAIYQKARTPRMRLLAMANIMRQHANYMKDNIFTGGWQATAVAHFADHIRAIAKDLD